MKSSPITLAKLTSKRTWKAILSWVLYFAIIGCVVFGAIAVINAVDSDTRPVVTSWARGTLDEEGNYQESKTSIYTKNAFECAGLEITLDFDAEIQYEVVFYDEDGKCITSARTGLLDAKFDAEELPDGAFYARVIVTPVDDATVGTLEVVEYAGQIHINVAK